VRRAATVVPSSVAITTPFALARSSITVPQGSIHEAVAVALALLVVPAPLRRCDHHAWFSTARARSSRCQCAAPVCAVNAAGTSSTSAPRSLDQRAIQLWKPDVVADREAELRPADLDDDPRVAGGGRVGLAQGRAAGMSTSNRWILR